MKFIVWHSGDTSVGINGDQAEVEIDVEGFDENDQKAYIQTIKERLGEAFGDIWGFKATVMTQEDLDKLP
jgi:hypothetical protein